MMGLAALTLVGFLGGFSTTTLDGLSDGARGVPVDQVSLVYDSGGVRGRNELLERLT